VERAATPDCESCEAPCCRRQLMDDATGWFTLADARALYRPAGADVKVVGWVQRADGRQPLLECQAFDLAHHACTVYDRRPEHCRIYDCRDDDPEEELARPHCDLARHRRMEARRKRRS
jgi:hypothetical protein